MHRVQPTHLDEFLAPRIARIELDRRKSFQFRTQVCTRRLSDTRWTGYEDGAKDVHATLARLLETRFQARRPVPIPGHVNGDRKRVNAKTDQSCNHCCSFST